MTPLGEAPSVDQRAGDQYDYHCFEPATGHGLKHNPMQAIIAPRPIGWISSISQSGHRNLAPYSFFNMLRGDPPLIGFSSGGRKDSLRNIEEARPCISHSPDALYSIQPLRSASAATRVAADRY